MRKRRLLIGCILIPFLLCGGTYLGFNYLSSLCDQDTVFARLDAGSNRLITITAENCWEVGRGLYYEVSSQGVVISPQSMIDVDEGSDNHSYSLIYAESESLVGVLDMAVTPARIVAIYDFKSGQTW